MLVEKLNDNAGAKLNRKLLLSFYFEWINNYE